MFKKNQQFRLLDGAELNNSDIKSSQTDIRAKAKVVKNIEIDKLDRQILSMLMDNAKIPYTEIAKRLYVSGGTVHVRMKKLEDAGVVKGYSVDVDYAKLGYDISAFLGIYLDKSSLYKEVVAALERIPEVVAAYYSTGLYSIFLRIICRDTNHLREVLHEKIQKIEGIQRTETFISLDESINRHLGILGTEELPD